MVHMYEMKGKVLSLAYSELLCCLHITEFMLCFKDLNSFCTIIIILFWGVRVLVPNLPVNCFCKFSLVVELLPLYFGIVYCEPIPTKPFLCVKVNGISYHGSIPPKKSNSCIYQQSPG